MKPVIAICVLLLGFPVVHVKAAPSGYFDLTPGIMLDTGDAWQTGAKRYRLYGVQSCLRGTFYTDVSGKKRDCGEASMAVLAAFIKDTRPVCAPVVEVDGLTFVICYAVVGKQRLDLGLMMITKGYAFAALDRDGLPVHAPYAVAEQGARLAGEGLWQFKDIQHPAILLSGAAKRSGNDNGP